MLGDAHKVCRYVAHVQQPFRGEKLFQPADLIGAVSRHIDLLIRVGGQMKEFHLLSVRAVDQLPVIIDEVSP